MLLLFGFIVLGDVCTQRIGKGSSGTVRLFTFGSRWIEEADILQHGFDNGNEVEIYDWEYLEDQAGIFNIHYVKIGWEVCTTT